MDRFLQAGEVGATVRPRECAEKKRKNAQGKQLEEHGNNQKNEGRLVQNGAGGE
jgi:hypothetical protein